MIIGCGNVFVFPDTTRDHIGIAKGLGENPCLEKALAKANGSWVLVTLTEYLKCATAMRTCSSLSSLNGLSDGGHRLGSASLFAATAAPPLRGFLGLFLNVQGWQWELLGHDRHAGRSRCFLEEGRAKLLVEVLAKEVSIADVGAWRAAVLQRVASGPGWIGTGVSLVGRGAGPGEGAVERAGAARRRRRRGRHGSVDGNGNRLGRRRGWRCFEMHDGV